MSCSWSGSVVGSYRSRTSSARASGGASVDFCIAPALSAAAPRPPARSRVQRRRRSGGRRGRRAAADARRQRRRRRRRRRGPARGVDRLVGLARDATRDRELALDAQPLELHLLQLRVLGAQLRYPLVDRRHHPARHLARRLVDQRPVDHRRLEGRAVPHRLQRRLLLLHERVRRARPRRVLRIVGDQLAQPHDPLARAVDLAALDQLRQRALVLDARPQLVVHPELAQLVGEEPRLLASLRSSGPPMSLEAAIAGTARAALPARQPRRVRHMRRRRVERAGGERGQRQQRGQLREVCRIARSDAGRAARARRAAMSAHGLADDAAEPSLRGELYKFGTLQWNKRYFVLDEAGSIIFYWSDARTQRATRRRRNPPLHGGASSLCRPAVAGAERLAGALTLWLRDGHSDASVTLAAETLAVLESWRDAVAAHAQAVPAAQRALERWRCGSRRGAQRQGWLWKKRDVGTASIAAGSSSPSAVSSYYSTFDADTPTKVVDRRCTAHEVASPSGAAAAALR